MEHCSRNRTDTESDYSSSSTTNYPHTVASSNSLKNFVVTGRNSVSSGQFDCSSIHLPASFGLPIASYVGATQPNQTDVFHSRSKSMGVSSKFSLDRKLTSKGKNCSSNPTCGTTNDNIVFKRSATPTEVKQSNSIPLFTSPYVNKYDTSVQNLGIDQGLNLYSVPNRRTSIALNSLDDSFLLRMSNASKQTVPVTVGNKPNRFTYITCAVTTSPNSVSFSTVRHHYDQSKRTSQSSIHSLPPLSSLTHTINSNVSDAEMDGLVGASLPPPVPPNHHRSNHTFQPAHSWINETGNIESCVDSPSKVSHQMVYNSCMKNKAHSIEDDNLEHYKSLLIRSNSFGFSGSYPKFQQPSTKVEHNTLKCQVNYGDNSNYVNLEPIDESMAKFSPRSDCSVKSKVAIYENAQSLLSKQSNNYLDPPNTKAAILINSNVNPVMPQKKPVKLWYETDLDCPFTSSPSLVRSNQASQMKYSSNTSLVSNNSKENVNIKPSNKLLTGQFAKAEPKLNWYDDTGSLIESPVDDDVNNVLDQQPNEANLFDSTSSISHRSNVLVDLSKKPLASGHHRMSAFSQYQNSLVPSSSLEESTRSLTASPTPSNLSSTSSTASSFLFNNSRHSHNTPTTHHYYANPYSNSMYQTNATVPSTNVTPTGSIVSHQSTFGPSSVSTSSLSSHALPCTTVAFVPPVVGQDAVSINSCNNSTANTSVTNSNSAPIASCKGNIVEVDVVTVGHFQAGYEETKPYTLSDFYKYSQRYRNAFKVHSQTEADKQETNIVDLKDRLKQVSVNDEANSSDNSRPEIKLFANSTPTTAPINGVTHLVNGNVPASNDDNNNNVPVY